MGLETAMPDHWLIKDHRLRRTWVFFKILLYIMLFSQTFVFGGLIVESMLPFVDQVLNHLSNSVLEPYLNLIWRKLFNWICVYITVPTLILIITREIRSRRKDILFRASEFSAYVASS